MNETGIIWTERTWNAVSGCKKITAGCKFCYAHTLAEQRRGTPAFPNGFDLTYRPHKLKEPLKLKEPSIIFVNSMSDMFWDEISDEYRDKMVDIMEQTPQHEYQVLTKRPDIMQRYSERRALPVNFWAGTTIESERVKADRLEALKATRASLKFISAEPLLTPLNLTAEDLAGVDWIITGGESGGHLWKDDVAEHRALVRYDRQLKKWMPREDRMQWIRDIRDICEKTGVKFFHKQWGGHYPEAAGRLLDGRFYSEMPRYPQGKNELSNEYLKQIEGKTEGDRDKTLVKSL
jgi:protein gp37